ncbi:MAG TPA: hypothetical protein VK815_17695 [Candidatus Acidoferrales bacterium]|nr:hypothetical protein [Candidatus Acidoferrales bacterium]
MKSHRHNWLDRLRERFKWHVWPVIHRLAWPVVWLRRRLRPHKISMRRLEGGIAGSEHPLTMLFAAKEHKAYLQELVFPKVTRETDLGVARLMDVFRPEYGRGKNAGMVILETNQSLHQWLDDGSWFFIPAWVVGEVRLPLPEKTLRSDTIRTIRRKIRKYGFEYEAVGTTEQFKDYYYNMHVPYITKIYGPAACVQSYEEMQTRCEAAGFDLILLRKKDRPDVFVSGCLIIYEAHGPRLWSFGVRDGNVELVQEGVLSALYLFCFEHLLKKGFAQVNMGGNRPFLRDGVLAIKKRISQTLLLGRWEGFALKVLELTPATKSFLVNNPFIFLANGRLHGAVFTTAPLTVTMVGELADEHFYPGLGKLLLFFFERNVRFQMSDLPPELAARVEIRAAAEVVSGHLHLP